MAFVPDETPSRFVPDEQPAAPKGKPMPANAGAVNLAASVLGIPVDAVANVLNLGIAGAGAATGTTPGLIQSPVGGSEWIKQKLRATGVGGLSPDNPNPDSGMGKAQFDLAARGGFLPGGFVPALSSMAAEKIGGPQWSGVGAMVPSAVTQAYNAARAPSLARAEQNNAGRDAAFRAGREEGLVAPPSVTNPNFVTNQLESIGGRAAVAQEANIRNQQAVNDIARRELGIPPNVQITTGTLEKLRSQAAKPYEDVAAISPLASTALQKLRDARSESQTYWLSYNRNARPEDLRVAKAADARAEQMENLLERVATRSGKPELVQELRDARTYIAKTYDVQNAMNHGNYWVSGNAIGRAFDKADGKKLTGGLQTVGRFDQAFEGRFTRPAGGIQDPDVSALNPVASATAIASGHPVAGGLPFLREPARNLLLSDFYQRNFATPSYTPAVLPESGLQMLLRQAAMQNAQ